MGTKQKKMAVESHVPRHTDLTHQPTKSRKWINKSRTERNILHSMIIIYNIINENTI